MRTPLAGLIPHDQTGDLFQLGALTTVREPSAGGGGERDCDLPPAVMRRLDEVGPDRLDPARRASDEPDDPAWIGHRTARHRCANANSSDDRAPLVTGARRCMVLTASRTLALCRTSPGADRSALSSRSRASVSRAR